MRPVLRRCLALSEELLYGIGRAGVLKSIPSQSRKNPLILRRDTRSDNARQTKKLSLCFMAAVASRR